MYYLQGRSVVSGRWSRFIDDESEPCYEEAIDALERADEIRDEWPRDGLQRGVRVVDDSGKIITYTSGNA